MGFFATWHLCVSMEDVSCVVGLNTLIQSYTQSLLIVFICVGRNDTRRYVNLMHVFFFLFFAMRLI